MSKQEADLPLYLYQVLEEEYERINGELPPSWKNLPPNEKTKERLDAIISDIHDSTARPDWKPHTALCLSGGGIRSATFGLGVLQGLARRGLLEQFSYLSTVSGGGYVGGWLSAWLHRHPRGMAGVVEELKRRPDQKLMPEPKPVLHLRSYSNYLTPRLGFLSADTWTMAAIVVRNLILNWLVLIPLILVALMLPRLVAGAARLNFAAQYRPWALGLMLLLAFAGGVTAVAYTGIKRPSLARDPNKLEGFLRWCLLPLLVSAVAVTTFWVWYRRPAVDVQAQVEGDFATLLPSWLSFVPAHYLVPFLLFGLALYLTGWAIYSGYHRRLKFWIHRERRFEFAAMVMSGLAGGLLLWLAAAKAFYQPDLHYRSFTTFAAPIYLALFLLGLVLFAGLSSEDTLDEDREWWARFGAWLLIAICGWSVVSFLVLVGPEQLFVWREEYVVPAGGLVGLLTAYLAHSAKAPPNEREEKRGGIKALLMRHALTLGSIIFTALLIVLLSILTNYLLAIVTILLTPLFSPEIAPVAGGSPVPPLSNYWWLLSAGQQNGVGQAVGSPAELGLSAAAHKWAIISAPLPLLLVLTAAVLLLGLYLSRRINTNKFSYHAMYRNRLIRAYLGASNQHRDENPFTGFDPHDNIPMHELRPEMFHPGSFTNLGQFVLKLRNEKDGYYEWFLKRMSDETQARIAAYNPKGKPKKVLLRALVRELNWRFVYKGDPLIDDRLGVGLDILPENARDIYFKYHPDQPRDDNKPRRPMNEMRPDDLARFNRLFIQAALPGEFIDYDPAARRPFHVVNMALNLVRGTNLAWQDRKAESFTASPLHCGSCQIPDYEDEEDESGTKPEIYGSYRRSHEYGGKDSGGISLGTAVAVSGAAVSPNMGYYSSPLVTFLMTLFNVRLGWWLGNPGKAGADVYHVANPESSARPIIDEALGLTDDDNPYVYLSDGGHFENLGLYEMVLRRCRTIVVSDASDDSGFKLDNLGNAIRKIRIDFGIPIEFKSMFIYPRAKGHGGAFCAVGKIEYSRADSARGGGPAEAAKLDGTLIYIKPVFYGDEPRDIYHYAQANERFPHESTADQWFSEEQFESYRALGTYIVGRVAAGDKKDPASLEARTLEMEEFVKAAQTHVGRYETMAEAAEARLAVQQMNRLIMAAAKTLPLEESPKPAGAAAAPGDGFTG